MAANPLTVYCTYDETGPELEELILEAFRIFLREELESFSESSSDSFF